MFLGVSLSRTFRVLSGMDGVSGRRVSMMGRFFMLATVMMLGRFTVMAGGMRMMFRCLPMVISCFLRHAISSLCGALSLHYGQQCAGHHSLIGMEAKHFDGNKFPLFELL